MPRPKLKSDGEEIGTTQGRMCCANKRLTRGVYAQALTPLKRAAHSKVVELIRPAGGRGVVSLCSHTEEADSVSA